MRPLDTTAKAAAIQEELHSKLGPSGRVALAMRMSELAREFAIAGLRRQKPDLDESQLARELSRLFYGR